MSADTEEQLLVAATEEQVLVAAIQNLVWPMPLKEVRSSTRADGRASAHVVFDASHLVGPSPEFFVTIDLGKTSQAPALEQMVSALDAAYHTVEHAVWEVTGQVPA